MGAPLAGCRKPDCNLFSGGHDFSRAVSDAKLVRLQPLRFTANVVNEFFRNLPEFRSKQRSQWLTEASSDPTPGLYP